MFGYRVLLRNSGVRLPGPYYPTVGIRTARRLVANQLRVKAPEGSTPLLTARLEGLLRDKAEIRTFG